MLDDRAIFAVLAEAGSFAGAARQLGVARSTVMRRLDALESELGLRLVQRAGRRLVLTEAGRGYAEALRGVLRELERVENELRSEEATPSGKLRVWLPILGTSAALAPAVASFMDAHPAVVVHLELGRDVRHLELGAFDLALQFGFRINTELAARTLMRDRMILVASSAYVREHGLPRSVDALRHHRAVHARDVEGKLIHWRDPSGARVPMPPASVEVNSVGFAFQLARAGAGVVWAPSLLAAPGLESGELVHLCPECWTEEPVNFVYLPDPTVTTRAFLDHMVAWFRERG